MVVRDTDHVSQLDRRGVYGQNRRTRLSRVPSRPAGGTGVQLDKTTVYLQVFLENRNLFWQKFARHFGFSRVNDFLCTA